jgi:hypothetical protein
MSNSLSISVLMMCQDRSTSPLSGSSDGMPQPSSEFRYCGRGTHSKGGHLVQEEVQPVVVVEDDDDIGLLLAQPLANRREAVKERFPVRVLLQALVDGAANGGDVGGADAAYELCHGVVCLSLI